METADFDYELPDERIAQTPVEPRDAARLLVDRGAGVEPDDRHVSDLAELLEPGDLLVVNETRVLPARLNLVKDTGGHAEVFLLEPHAGGSIADQGPQQWVALVRPGRRLQPGTVVRSPMSGIDLSVEIGHDPSDGTRIVEVRHDPSVSQIDAIRAAGSVPLPPYITTPLDDPDRYQTTFSEIEAVPDSVAAPTAGLHLTPELLDRVRDAGVEVATVELAVGLGTFRPIAADKVEDHVMHSERYRVEAETWERIEAAKAAGRRVVAVGTTSVRTLESVAATGRLEGRTELFIHGDYPFKIVDRLLTNFHQPRSSLLVLIDAFLGPSGREREVDPSGREREVGPSGREREVGPSGREREVDPSGREREVGPSGREREVGPSGREWDAGPHWRELYAHALAGPYRFLSFGDAMLLTRRTAGERS